MVRARRLSHIDDRLSADNLRGPLAQEFVGRRGATERVLVGDSRRDLDTTLAIADRVLAGAARGDLAMPATGPAKRHSRAVGRTLGEEKSGK